MPGQGQKVMNAMWGAGQMMFNKILVLADGRRPLQDYKKLAAICLCQYCNPATDIIFHRRVQWMCLTIAAASWALAVKCASTERRSLTKKPKTRLPFPILSNRFDKQGLMQQFPEIKSHQ